MADTHEPAAHAGPDFRLYLIIFAALSVFTLLSFVVNWAEHQFGFSSQTGATIIMGIAIIKATLVAKNSALPCSTISRGVPVVVAKFGFDTVPCESYFTTLVVPPSV